MSRPLVVTVLCAHDAPGSTGVATYVAGLAQGLAVRGHDVRVLTAHVRGYGSWSADENLAGVEVHRLGYYAPARTTGLRPVLSEVTLGLRLALAHWGRADVVVLASPNLLTTALVWVRARLSRRRVVVWAQRLASLGPQTVHDGRSPALSRAVESAILRSAAGVVVNHERIRDAAVESLGVPSERIEVIRDWSRVPPVPPFDRPAARGRLGWSPEETVVLHASGIGVRQDLDNVVEAARLADEHQAPVRFVLLGDGTQRDRLCAAAADIRSLQFLDPLPETDFLQALTSADLLLVHEAAGRQAPSVPSMLTTYLAAGAPVLAVTEANSVTANELRAAGAGVRVETGSPRHLLQAVLALRADPARCRALGGSGRRYCDRHLGEPAAVDHFERWLHEVARVPMALAYVDAT